MILKKPSHFKLNHIYRMNVGERSHVKNPYFVEIIDIGKSHITTNIPGNHSLVITKEGDCPNWDYHIERFSYVGDKEKNGHLLINQIGLLK